MHNNERNTKRYTPPSVEEAPKETEVAVVANCENLNVRKGPGLNYAIKCVIPAGKVLAVLKAVGDFYHICTEDGVEGYCMKNYVDIQR